MSRPFPDFIYKDTALGDLGNRNHIMKVDAIPGKIPSHKRECYATIFRFPEEFRRYVEDTGSVKGYKGTCFADMFWVDVDDEDLGRSRESAAKVAGLFFSELGVPYTDLKMFFSGKKGFHLGVPTSTFGVEPSKYLPKAFSELARRISEMSGISLDLSIYKHVSLLRLPNSINNKSGLFKIGLTFEEFAGHEISAIKELAKEPRKSLPSGPCEPNEILEGLFRRILKEVAEEDAKPVDLPVIQASTSAEWPRWDKVCLYTMMKGVPNGQRNNVALRIAVHLRQKGMPLDMATSAMLCWNKHNETPLDDVDVADITRRAYESTYDFGCHDPVLDRYCFDQCHLYRKKVGDAEESGSHIFSAKELMEKYLAYIKDLDKAKVSWGIPWLDTMTRKMAPGQVGCIMARAGVGKTALTLHLVQANSELGIPSLFCSLEQLGAEIFERMAQNANEMPGEEIEVAFAREEIDLIEQLGSVVQRKFEHVYVCDDDRLTVKQLKDRVKAAEVKCGEKIRLLVVDYLGRMKGDGKDYYQRVSELAIGLKEVAKECELAVVVLVQVNRTGGKGAIEVTMDMARDSGQVEEAVDYAIGMWRANGEEPGAGRGINLPGPNGEFLTVRDAKDHYPVLIQINKNRKGPAGDQARIALIFRPAVMRFEDLTWKPTERAQEMEWSPQ